MLHGCIASHHVAEVDYTDLHLTRSTLRVRPAVISVNSASHVVLWCMPVDVAEWRELLLDRVALAELARLVDERCITSGWQRRPD